MAEQSKQKISPGEGLEMGKFVRQFDRKPTDLVTWFRNPEEVAGSILDNDVEKGT